MKISILTMDLFSFFNFEFVSLMEIELFQNSHYLVLNIELNAEDRAGRIYLMKTLDLLGGFLQLFGGINPESEHVAATRR